MGSCFGNKQEHNEEGNKPVKSGGAADDNEPSSKKVRNAQPAMSIWVARGMPDTRPEFTTANRTIVKESWVHLRGNMHKVCMIVFGDIVMSVPAMKRAFDRANTSMERTQTSQEVSFLNHHTQRVVLSVEKLVKFLDQEAKIDLYLHELGDRHASRDIRVEYLDLFVPFFISAIHPALDERWASTIEDSWAAFFTYILHRLKEAMVF